MNNIFSYNIIVNYMKQKYCIVMKAILLLYNVVGSVN